MSATRDVWIAEFVRRLCLMCPELDPWFAMAVAVEAWSGEGTDVESGVRRWVEENR